MVFCTRVRRRDMSSGTNVFAIANLPEAEKKAREESLGLLLSKKVPCNPVVTGRCADVMVRALEAEGISWIFGVPGEENLDILDSLREAERLKLVVTRHEQAAGFMAATVGRLTDHLGICLSTLGPGATNVATAAAYGHLGGFPMMILTGQKPIRHSKQGQFQIIDVVNLFQPVTKYAKQVSDPSRVPELVREATRLSMEEKPGPVHLELPEDIAGLPVADGTVLYPPHPVRRPVPDEKAVMRSVDLIKAATSPLLVIGSGANRKRVQNMLKQIMDELNLYAISTQMGKGVVSEHHPRFIGCAALSADDIVHVAIEGADLIVVVGHDLVEKPPFFMKPNEKPVVIHVNFTSANIDSVYFPHCEVIGDIGNSLWQIKEAIEPQAHWKTSFFEHCRKQQQQHVYRGPYCQTGNFPMDIQEVVRTLRQALEESAILCLDNGMYKIHVARGYTALEPNTVLLDNALASMGAGLPVAIASKLLHPERQVVALSGDGGFMMNSQELETAVRNNLHIVQLVINDGSYGMIKWKQGTEGFEDWGLDYGNPDFVKYAESYGAKGHRILRASDLPLVLQQCLSTPAVHVVDLPVNYASSDAALNVELPKIVDELRNELESWTEASSPIARESSASPSEKKRNEVSSPPIEGVLATEPLVKGEIPEVMPMWVGSKASINRDNLLEVTDKYTNEVITKVSLGFESDVNRAIEMAEAALPAVSKLPSYKRKKILNQAAAEFRNRFEEFAYALAREAGKPITDARGEVTRLIDTFEIAAEEAVRLYGEFTPLDISERNEGMKSVQRRFPIGVVSMVSPFNFPLNLAAHKIAPAICAGCPFILKPASKTPIGALMIAEALSKCSDLPDGAFSVIPCDRKVGDMFVTDERLKLLSFTGSPSVGWAMKERCGKKKTVLELGGNAACIVDSWDEAQTPLSWIIDRLAFGAFYQSGQSCIHLQRLYVRQDLYDRVVDAFVEKAKTLKKGNPLQPDTFVGPMITEDNAKRIEEWVNEAISRGATVLCGGKRYCQVYDATIVAGADHKCKLYREEAFAPVVVVEPYSDFKAVVKKVNDSRYGIHAGLFTTDLNRAIYAWENCEVGGVVIGDVPSMRVDAQPYGGVKDSGIGREGIRYAVEDMTELRTLLLKNIGDLP